MFPYCWALAVGKSQCCWKFCDRIATHFFPEFATPSGKRRNVHFPPQTGRSDKGMQMRATALKGYDEPNDVIAAGTVGKAYENRTFPVSWR